MLRSVLVVVAVVCVVGCRQQAPKAIAFNKSFDDKSQIKVAVFEHLIERKVKPSTNDLLFILADQNELGAISMAFPHYQIKSAGYAEISREGQVRDKASGKKGLLLEVKQLDISGQTARVLAGYFSGASVTFDFELKKDLQWQIEKVKGELIADPFLKQ